MTRKNRLILTALAVPFLWPADAPAQPRTQRTVTESAREIPLAHDVDVVVVGGSTRGVAAAVAAAKQGASVFLAASRPYLGEDMCATSRLWLEDGEVPESPLGRALFANASAHQPSPPLPPGVPFSYTSSLVPSAKHPDTTPPSRLTDGRRHSASRDSVQYDGDVVLTADLGAPTRIAGLSLTAYQRAGDFAVRDVRIAVSTDMKEWREVARVTNTTKGGTGDETANLRAVLDVRTRYLRLTVTRAEGCERILLAELHVEGPAPATAESTTKPAEPLMSVTTPMQVKRSLDDALLNAGVNFLYGSYIGDILRDRDGKVAGITIVNRSGRQAVRAKVIIDATDRGIAARLAGAGFAPYPAGTQPFTRIVLGGDPGRDAQELGANFRINDRVVKAYEYRLELPMRDDSWAAFARADQEARKLSWQTNQVAASEKIHQVPPDPLDARTTQTGPWPGAAEVDLDALRPADLDGVYVLGGCAALSREAAATLLRPLAGIDLGTRVGIAAADDARTREIERVAKITVTGLPAAGAINADVGEMLQGLRSGPVLGEHPMIRNPARGIPILARYDTVVVGGGTGGAPAGIGAARGGARTLVLEYLHGLGGVGTLGRITNYYHGNRVGFTAEIDAGVASYHPTAPSGKGWNIEHKMEWLRSEIVKAGGEVWFHTLGAGSIMHGDRCIGVMVATPHGRGAILANTVIDATGNAVIPACAGMETQATTGEHISVQGTGLPPMTPGESYLNSDWTFVDDDDVLDMWRIHVVGKRKYANAFDLGQLIDTRARRRIVGDIVISPMDIINNRVYPDVITVSKSNFDNHGFSSHPLFMITPPDKRGLVGNVPYRALMPKGKDGLLVTGLGMSAHGDAMPVMRMQPDVQNQGYAAGKASAMAAEAGTTIRRINVKALQKHLVEEEIIPESMLSAEDSYPVGPERLQTAVQSIGADYSGIALVFTDPATARPLLRKAWKNARGADERLRYAHVLGMLHDDTGAESLVEAVAAADWDAGWNFRGMGQFGASTSPVDNLIIALGRTRDPRGLPVVIAKLEAITPDTEFSHCRAVALALESYRDPRAAPALERFLAQPGVTGHAFVEIQDTIKRSPPGTTDTTTRNKSLRELILARALFRCGDRGGIAEDILRSYATDFRGHYATHAKSILNEKLAPTSGSAP